MLSRRAFLAGTAAAALNAQARPKLAFSNIVEDGVDFRRAYSAAPGAGITPLLTGVLPHAYGAGEPPRLTRFFEIVSKPDASTIVIAAGRPPEDSWKEESLHVPLAIRFPGKLEGGIASDVLISTIDVLPTVLALAGIELPEGIHGRPAALDRPTASIYCEGQLGTKDEWRAMIRGYDKMVTNIALQPLHLFNLADDARELEDLAQQPGFRLRADELRALMLDWKKRTGDGVDSSGLKRRKPR